MGAENEKLRVMLDTALRKSSRDIDAITAETIRKAAAK